MQILWQRLALGFGEEKQRDKAHEEDQADPATGVAEGFKLGLGGDGTGGEFRLEQAQGEGPAGGDKAPDVVTEAGTGAAQASGEQFRQVDGKAGKQRELTETHDR